MAGAYEPIGFNHRCRPRDGIDPLMRSTLRALQERVQELELTVTRLSRPYFEREPPHCPSCDCGLSDSLPESVPTAVPDSSASKGKRGSRTASRPRSPRSTRSR